MREGVCLSVFISLREKIELLVCSHISGSLRVGIVLGCLR